jgi:hypothetical protein
MGRNRPLKARGGLGAPPTRRSPLVPDEGEGYNLSVTAVTRPMLAGQDEPAMALTALLAKHRLGAVRVSGDADGAPQC